MPSFAVHDLVARLAERLKTAAAPAPTGFPSYPCPICDERMSVDGVSDYDWRGLKGTRVHTLRCASCGMAADRLFHPVVGYYPRIVI